MKRLYLLIMAPQILHFFTYFVTKFTITTHNQLHLNQHFHDKILLFFVMILFFLIFLPYFSPFQTDPSNCIHKCTFLFIKHNNAYKQYRDGYNSTIQKTCPVHITHTCYHITEIGEYTLEWVQFKD